MSKIKKTLSPILITGSTGFIGSNLLRRLVNQNETIHIIIRNKSNLWRIHDLLDKVSVHYLDITNKQRLNKVVKKIKPMTIFHLATYGAYYNQKNFNEIQNTILQGTINLLSACKNNKFKIFINTGTNSEYGFSHFKMKENHILKPNSYYAVFKSAVTNLLSYEAVMNKLPIITVRPFHIYGPYEESSRLIPTLIKNLLNNKKSKLVSKDISRDLLYIDDAIDLYLKIAKAKIPDNNIFNMGYGKQKSIKQIYDTLQILCKSNIKATWGTMKNRSWDQKKWISDITLTSSTFDWKPKFSLKKGLDETIKWSRSYYKY